MQSSNYQKQLSFFTAQKLNSEIVAKPELFQIWNLYSTRSWGNFLSKGPAKHKGSIDGTFPAGPGSNLNSTKKVVKHFQTQGSVK